MPQVLILLLWDFNIVSWVLNLEWDFASWKFIMFEYIYRLIPLILHSDEINNYLVLDLGV